MLTERNQHFRASRVKSYCLFFSLLVFSLFICQSFFNEVTPNVIWTNIKMRPSKGIKDSDTKDVSSHSSPNNVPEQPFQNNDAQQPKNGSNQQPVPQQPLQKNDTQQPQNTQQPVSQQPNQNNDTQQPNGSNQQPVPQQPLQKNDTQQPQNTQQPISQQPTQPKNDSNQQPVQQQPLQKNGTQQPQNTQQPVSQQPNQNNDAQEYFEKEVLRDLPSAHTCLLRRSSRPILCQLRSSVFCQTSEPADVIQDFWAVAPIYAYDQKRTEKMYQMHINFRDYIKSFGMSFCTIEAIRNDLNQTYMVTQPRNEPYDIQVQIYDEYYIRENLVNVAIKKLPHWEYVGWIDGHQMFDNTYWWEEAIVKMEKYASVQPFQRSKRMGQRNQTVYTNKGAIYLSLILNTIDDQPEIEYGNGFVLRRELYYEIGSILDVCIAGCCDLSYLKASFPDDVKFNLLSIIPRYIKNFESWINKVRSTFKGSRTIVRGAIRHFEHYKYFDYGTGPDNYDSQGFNATRDIARDENGTIKIINSTIRAILPSLNFYYFDPLK